MASGRVQINMTASAMTTTEPSNVRACVLRFTREDGSPGQLCGYLEPEPDGTLSFITREGWEFRQTMRNLEHVLQLPGTPNSWSPPSHGQPAQADQRLPRPEPERD